MSQLVLASKAIVTEVTWAKPTDSLASVTKLMAAHQVGYIAIAETTTDGDLFPVGIITERDIIRALALELDLKQTHAQQVMSSPVCLIWSEVSVSHASALMQAHQIGQIFVTKKCGQLEGVLTQESLLKAFDLTQVCKIEENLHQLISALPDLIMRMSGGGQYLDFFPTETFRVCGSRDLVGKNIYESGLPFETAEKRMGYIHQALKTRKVQIYEQQILVDGQIQIEEVRIITCAEDEVLVIVRDITDRKLTEHTLVEREEDFRGIFDQAAVGVYYSKPDGQFSAFNQKFCEILGFSGEELQANNFFDLSHPDDQDSDLEQSKQFFAGEISSYNIEKRFRRKNGSYFWGDLTISAIRTASGAIKYVLGILIDISDRKQVEETLQKLVEGAAIISGENFLILMKYIATALDVRYVMVAKTIPEGSLETLAFWADGQLKPNFKMSLENSPCAIAIAQGAFICASELQEQFIGNAIVASLQAKSYMGITMINSLGEVIGNLCILDDKPMTTTQKRANDILRIFAARIAAELERQEALGAVYQLNQELESRVEQRTEQLNKTNEKLIVANQELANATRLKDEFLANISHELRTPLNAILGMSEGILDEVFGKINDRQQKAVSTIETSGKHLLELITDILDISKIEAGKLELEISSVAIAHLCESSLNFVEQMAIKKNIRLKTAIQSDLGMISVDERRMRQALINLLSNAVKFTPVGGQVTLEVKLENIDKQKLHNTCFAQSPAPMALCFAVTDTGIGISPENINKLFQNFVQIDSSLNRQYEGTGLGLTLVKQIAELHGGCATVESAFGIGSCFSVWLPYTGETIKDKIATHQIRNPLDNPLILLIADRQGNNETISDYLTSRGHCLIFTEPGPDALAIAASLSPNLVLIDIQATDQADLEAIHQIHRNPYLLEVPIVALTLMGTEDEQERYLQAGVDQLIFKPIKLRQLSSAIEQLLAQK
jgi:PAS domain S-box-containing protein